MTADLGPAATPRPIPTPEDRMTAARQPGPTFATYLDRHDRDQLDAEAACARQERDDALDDLQVERAKTQMLTANMDRYRRELDAANTSRQRLQEQLDDMATQRNMAHTAAAIARTDVHHDIARQLDILAADPGILRDWLTTCDPQPTGFGELFHALAEKLRRADAPGLGSPADRAQDERTRIEEAIEKRLREAWPNWPIDDVWLEQVAAQAALAVVEARP